MGILEPRSEWLHVRVNFFENALLAALGPRVSADFSPDGYVGILRKESSKDNDLVWHLS